MKRIGNIGFWWVILWMAGIPLQQSAAQNNPANIWATVQFSKQQVVAGEPLVVTFTVYTSTWFTGPPQFDEIQVPEAIMVEYEQRSGALRKTVGKKSYPAIEKKYFVFPFRVGTNTLPEMKIIVESPDEGDYKGKRRVIRSPERSFNVNPISADSKGSTTLTAMNVTINEQWSGSMEELIQGNVLERRVTIRSMGSLAALIPPLEIRGGGFGNVYQQGANLSNVQQNGLITGTREEHWSYLLEKAGTFLIPGLTVSWFDPRSGSIKSAGTDPKEITIGENPNLDFLLTMQDSLRMMLNEEGDSEVAGFEWMGLNWWQLGLVIVLIPLVIFLIYRFIVFISSEFSIRKEKRRESEVNHFQMLGELADQGDPVHFYNQLLKWYDHFRSRKSEHGPGLAQFLTSSGIGDLSEGYERLNKVLFGDRNATGWSGKKFYAALKRYRKNVLKNGKGKSKLKLPDINHSKHGRHPAN